MMRFWANYAQQYYTMPVSAILAQDASNMALPYAAIDAVYFRAIPKRWITATHRLAARCRAGCASRSPAAKSSS